MWDELLNLVNNGLFPIVACVALAWYIYKQTAFHKAEVDNLAKVINSNTKTIEKLIERIEEK